MRRGASAVLTHRVASRHLCCDSVGSCVRALSPVPHLPWHKLWLGREPSYWDRCLARHERLPDPYLHLRGCIPRPAPQLLLAVLLRPHLRVHRHRLFRVPDRGHGEVDGGCRAAPGGELAGVLRLRRFHRGHGPRGHAGHFRQPQSGRVAVHYGGRRGYSERPHRAGDLQCVQRAPEGHDLRALRRGPQGRDPPRRLHRARGLPRSLLLPPAQGLPRARERPFGDCLRLPLRLWGLQPRGVRGHERHHRDPLRRAGAGRIHFQDH
mmetsp:Transcript_123865/g.361698  ORF Transcript_123865/g.361698 Transcript_123865/m.361698 type:complete len:265 (-) Transcript_123865:767-1561(-)